MPKHRIFSFKIGITASNLKLIKSVGGQKYISENFATSYEQTASLFTVDGTNLIKSKTTSEMKQQRANSKAVAIGSKIYCFGGDNTNEKCFQIESCEVYCRKFDTWNLIAPFPGEYTEFCCACSFMSKIYLFGDIYADNWVYEPTKNSWNEIKNCNDKRKHASCTVFRGQCVVIGGRNYPDTVLKSVESLP